MSGNRYRYGKRLYGIWIGIRSRCRNPNVTSYHLYGGRGIKVCDEWMSYEAFALWALENGYNDSLTIEREDVDGDYCPSNCSWISKGDQARNRRNNRKVTINGVTKTGAEWARMLGMEKHAFNDRIDSGMTPEEAFKKKPRSSKVMFEGELLTITEIAKRTGVNYRTLVSRLQRGISVEDATAESKHRRIENENP